MTLIDMDIPKCCDNCPMLDDYGDYPRCVVNQAQHGYSFNTREQRMPECPLHKVGTVAGVGTMEICGQEVPCKFSGKLNDSGLHDLSFEAVNLYAHQLILALRQWGEAFANKVDKLHFLLMQAADRLEEQAKVIEQYKKADTFLAAHGWKWEEK